MQPALPPLTVKRSHAFAGSNPLGVGGAVRGVIYSHGVMARRVASVEMGGTPRSASCGCSIWVCRKQVLWVPDCVSFPPALCWA